MAKITRAELRKLISEAIDSDAGLPKVTKDGLPIFWDPYNGGWRQRGPETDHEKELVTAARNKNLRTISTTLYSVIESLEVVGDNPELLAACIKFYNYYKSRDPYIKVELDPWDGSYTRFNIITPDGKTLNSGLGPIERRHIDAGAVDIQLFNRILDLHASDARAARF